MSKSNFLNEKNYKEARQSIMEWPLWKRALVQSTLPPYAKPICTDNEIIKVNILSEKYESNKK